MSYEPSEFGLEVLEDIRTFCQRDLKDLLIEAEKQGEWPEAAYAAAAEMGIGTLPIPEEYGGTGLDLIDQAAVQEALASCDAGIAVSFMVNRLIVSLLENYGTTTQKKKCYDHILDGGFVCFCLTEEEAGSDVTGVRMTASCEQDSYVLNGNKIFVTNGSIASLFVVFANCEDSGLTAFLVDADAEGVQVGPEESKLGIRNSSTCEVSFDHVRIPYEHRIGEEGEGLRIALQSLSAGRVWCGVTALGIAQAAIDLSCDYVKQRRQFGKALAENEVIQFKLADMYMKTESARQCCIAALKKMEAGESVALESAAAKCLATDAAMHCAQEAVQLFGGNGYCRDYPVEKLFRDAKVFQIFEGTNEIQRLIIGRELVK